MGSSSITHHHPAASFGVRQRVRREPVQYLYQVRFSIYTMFDSVSIPGSFQFMNWQPGWRTWQVPGGATPENGKRSALAIGSGSARETIERGPMIGFNAPLRISGLFFSIASLRCSVNLFWSR